MNVGVTSGLGGTGARRRSRLTPMCCSSRARRRQRRRRRQRQEKSFPLKHTPPSTFCVRVRVCVRETERVSRGDLPAGLSAGS